MSAINSVTLVGNLGQDVDLTYLPGSGTAVAKFSIAVNRPPKNGEKQDPDWFNIALYGKRAEAASTILEKGDKVAVEGSIHTFSFKGKDGGTVKGVSIDANDWQLLVKRNGGNGGESEDEDEADEPASQEPAQQYPF